MSAHEQLIDPAELDFSQIVADVDAIRAVIPQRGPLEQLTAVLVDDVNRGLCVGYKDVRGDEFWVPGHMPGMPILPGILMCEAAAQLFSYYVQRHDILGVALVGFGGLNGVRFRGGAKPGDRLVIACLMTRFRRGRMTQCQFQIFGGTALIAEGEIVGVPIPEDLVPRREGAPKFEEDMLHYEPSTLVEA